MSSSRPSSSSPSSSPIWIQKTIRLQARPRGCHLVTSEILAPIRAELAGVAVGLCNIFIQHTSASLLINENADPDVRVDMEAALNRIAPEGTHYIHSDEGPDDMPGHIKAALLGASLTVPVRDGRLALGTWQGVWLAEHRDRGGSRSVVVTVQGVGKLN
ncbi:hypothetical protein DFJ73DRAFT_667998 [Zopfochytrium polystomum]|nr:hypothetical protein DFJ73DRAFT_667998 [Zopfochytrium polystomum]